MPIDLRSRVKTKFEEDEQRVENRELETQDANHLLQQEKLTQAGEYEEKTDVGRSLLSPRNSIQKELQKKEAQPKKVLSPFSKEFEEIATQREEKYMEEMEKDTSISSNRIQFYMIFAFVLYIISLCIGYHYTTFNDDIPQIVDLLIADPEYVNVYDRKVLSDQMFDRYDGGFSRYFVVKMDGKVVSTCSTYGEVPGFALVGGVIVHPDYRRRGLAGEDWRIQCCYASKIHKEVIVI